MHKKTLTNYKIFCCVEYCCFVSNPKIVGYLLMWKTNSYICFVVEDNNNKQRNNSNNEEHFTNTQTPRYKLQQLQQLQLQHQQHTESIEVSLFVTSFSASLAFLFTFCAVIKSVFDSIVIIIGVVVVCCYWYKTNQ